MKVLQVPFTFPPDPIGGTEIYVEWLAHCLKHFDVDSVIGAPIAGTCAHKYDYHGLWVRRFGAASASPALLQELYGEGDPQAAAAFEEMLDEERPDVVHLHAFTSAVSLLSVRAAKQRGLPVYFTYHTPTVSCPRGTLMLNGEEVCDGVLRAQRCARCVLIGLGLPKIVAATLSHVPESAFGSMDKIGFQGKGWTALRMRELVGLRHQAFRGLMREVDAVVVPKEWVRKVLLANGVLASKIVLSQQGLPGMPVSSAAALDVTVKPLRVAFLGRADPTKGIDTLVDAVRNAPDLDIELHVYGVTQSDRNNHVLAKIKRAADMDSRIVFLPPVPHDEIISLLTRYHVLAVPSRWMETGPLVVLEAFAAGTPVIGSNLGGIAEWVQHEVDGLLVEQGNVADWTKALRRCAEDRRLLKTWRRAIRRPRDMMRVADDMSQLYRSRANLQVG